MRLQQMKFRKGKDKIFFVHMNKPITNGLAGMVCSPLFDKNIPIKVNEEIDQETECDFACLAWAEDYTFPRIIMTKELYYDIKRGKTYARMILLHEIGHYYHNNGTHASNDERIEFVNKKKVHPAEASADSFAVECLGRNAVLSGLNHLLRLIEEKYADYADKFAVDIVIEEIRLRISLIEGIK